jgi:hypothetical protein
VHLFDSFVPALLASNNLGIPVILTCFFPSVFFKFDFSLNLASETICSTIPHLDNYLIKFGVGSYLEPNLSTFVVKVSFV